MSSEIERLRDAISLSSPDEAPELQVEATLALAEQVERIADLLKSIVSKDITSRKSLDVFVEMG